MRASLPMYTLPALREANRNFWKGIRVNLHDAGLDAPESLSPDGFGPEFWSAEDLIFSQTCGMPYRTGLAGVVQIVGTPDYGIEGCMPGYYYSVLIKRKEDARSRLDEFAGARVAVNDFQSQSGYAALATEIADSNIRFANCVVTGAHVASVEAVARREADIAAIDAVTWRLLARGDDVCELVEIIGHTDPTPGLPFICAKSICGETVFGAVSQAIHDMSPIDRECLMIRGLVKISDAAYMSVPTPQAREVSLLHYASKRSVESARGDQNRFANLN